MSDLRFAVRQLGRQPSFTIIAILTLAFGIGVNTSLFSILSGLFLRPQPGVRDAGRLVWVTGTEGRRGRPTNLSYPDFADYREGAARLMSMAAFGNLDVSFSAGGVAERVRGEIVSSNYFDVLGVRMQAGRAFLPDEDRTPETSPVAILGDGIFRRRFAADPAVVGRTVTINGRAFTVVGVAPPRFNGADVTDPNDVWLPMMMQRTAIPEYPDMLTRRGSWWLKGVGRLAPGVTVDAARAALAPVVARIAEANPDRSEIKGVALQSMRGGVVPGDAGDAIPIAALALAVTALVLLIACANVANLLLGRAAARRREIAVRVAMGAARWRVVRQLLIESATLALLAGALGVLFSFWALDLVVGWLNADIPIETNPNAWVLGFALLLSLGTTLLFGLVPALATSRPDLTSALKDNSAGAGSRSRLQGGFVIAQVSLSLVLLVTAGLFLRSLAKAAAVDPGFDASGRVLTVSFNLGLQGYTGQRSRAFLGDLRDRAGALPGVRSVSFADLVPMSGWMHGNDIIPDDSTRPAADAATRGERGISIRQTMVWPGWFATVGVPLVLGRDFTDADHAGAPAVAIVNETLARRLWPDGKALGHRFRVVGGDRELVEIVGVARDAKYDNLSERPQNYIYFALRQNDSRAGETALFVRSSGDAAALTSALRATLHRQDPDLPLRSMRTMGAVVQDRLRDRRNGSVLLGVFGALAAVLAAIGVYGVMAHAVARRTREIGVRIALGAATGDVLRLVLGQGLRLTMFGIVIGVAIAAALTRLLSGLIFGVGVTDAATFLSAAALMVGVALLASWVPARAAARVDPVRALRTE